MPALGDVGAAHKIYEHAYYDVKKQGLRGECLELVKKWLVFEQQHGSAEVFAKVEVMKPKPFQKTFKDEYGHEVKDWVLEFPDDLCESNPTTFKFLQMAHAWKQAGGTRPFANLEKASTNAVGGASQTAETLSAM